MQFERLAVLRGLGERMLAEAQLEDSVQSIDDVLAGLFARAPLAQRAGDFGDRRNYPALLIGLVHDRQAERLAHATNATPWRRISLAHDKGLRRPRLRLARSGTLDRLRQVDRVYAMRYTRCMAKTVPVREFRSRLSELLSDVADRRDHVLVTRNGKPAAVLVPIDEYEALEETAEILSDSATLAAIEAGLAELSREKTVTLAELRAELAHRRTTR